MWYRVGLLRVVPSPLTGRRRARGRARLTGRSTPVAPAGSVAKDAVEAVLARVRVGHARRIAARGVEEGGKVLRLVGGDDEGGAVQAPHLVDEHVGAVHAGVVGEDDAGGRHPCVAFLRVQRLDQLRGFGPRGRAHVQDLRGSGGVREAGVGRGGGARTRWWGRTPRRSVGIMLTASCRVTEPASVCLTSQCWMSRRTGCLRRSLRDTSSWYARPPGYHGSRLPGG